MDIDKRNSIDLTSGKNIPNLSNDFNTYLETKSQIDRLGYNPNIPCKIHFYEWSDLNQEKTFDNAIGFIQFLTKCKIYTKYWEDTRIKKLAHSDTGVYVICKPGKTDVIIEDTYDGLVKAFDIAKNSPTTTTTYSPPCVPAVVNQQGVGYGGYSAYGCGPDYDGWDEWD